MTHASVFSGIGGPEVAATMLGWENLFHCEINPFGWAVVIPAAVVTGEWWLFGVPFFSTTIGRLLSQ